MYTESGEHAAETAPTGEEIAGQLSPWKYASRCHRAMAAAERCICCIVMSSGLTYETTAPL